MNLNKLSKENRNLLYSYLEEPTKRRAEEVLEATPKVLLVARDAFGEEELIDFFSRKFQSKPAESYISDFLEADCASLIGLEKSSAAFIVEVGSQKASRTAKRLSLEKNLG